MDIKIKKINFEGNILKVIKATVTEMRGINNHQKYDFDLYQIEARSPMSTREITLTVDFIEKKVSGDIIAFGDWYDLEGKLFFLFLILFRFICFNIFRKNF